MNASELHVEPRDAMKRSDERLFQTIFVVSFPIFFLVVIAARLLPTASEGKKEVSILSEASESARSTIAMALMD